MKKSESEYTHCVKCGVQKNDGQECLQCGVIYSKAEEALNIEVETINSPKNEDPPQEEQAQAKPENKENGVDNKLSISPPKNSTTRISKNFLKYSISLCLVIGTFLIIYLLVFPTFLMYLKYDTFQRNIKNRHDQYVTTIDSLNYLASYSYLSIYSKQNISMNEWESHVFSIAKKTTEEVVAIVVEPSKQKTRVDVKTVKIATNEEHIYSQTWVYEAGEWYRAYIEDKNKREGKDSPTEKIEDKNRREEKDRPTEKPVSSVSLKYLKCDLHGVNKYREGEDKEFESSFTLTLNEGSDKAIQTLTNGQNHDLNVSYTPISIVLQRRTRTGGTSTIIDTQSRYDIDRNTLEINFQSVTEFDTEYGSLPFSKSSGTGKCSITEAAKDRKI